MTHPIAYEKLYQQRGEELRAEAADHRRAKAARKQRRARRLGGSDLRLVRNLALMVPPYR